MLLGRLKSLLMCLLTYTMKAARSACHTTGNAIPAACQSLISHGSKGVTYCHGLNPSKIEGQEAIYHTSQ